MFTDYLYEGSKEIWNEYLEHQFIKELGNGNLDKEKFRRYLIQDYLYLKEYTKVYCMGVVKSNKVEEMTKFYQGVGGILLDETANHIMYLKDEFKESIEDVENYSYHKVTDNYTNYMKGISLTGDIKEIIASVLPCTWSYSFIGKHLKEAYKDKLKGSFYESWIETYGGDEFTKFTQEWIEFTNEVCKGIDEKEKEKLRDIFRKASVYEMDFWDMAYEG